MPALTEQNDVANSGLRPGFPLRYAGITMSCLPTGPMCRKPESKFVPPAFTPSGLNQKYGTRFDDNQYYTA